MAGEPCTKGRGPRYACGAEAVDARGRTINGRATCVVTLAVWGLSYRMKQVVAGAAALHVRDDGVVEQSARVGVGLAAPAAHLESLLLLAL